MSTVSVSSSSPWRRAWAAVLTVIPLAYFPGPAVLAEEPIAHPVAATQPAPGKPAPRLTAGQRKFAEKLELNDTQQAELAKILARQRQEIRKLWQQQNVPPGYRTAAMRAISDRTHDEIRAMLNDEQKKKYPAQHAAETPTSEQQQSLMDQWLNAPAK